MKKKYLEATYLFSVYNFQMSFDQINQMVPIHSIGDQNLSYTILGWRWDCRTQAKLQHWFVSIIFGFPTVSFYVACRIQAFHPNLKIPRSSLFLQPHLLTSIPFIFKHLSWISPGLLHLLCDGVRIIVLLSQPPTIFSGGKVCVLPIPALLAVLLEPNSFLRQLDFSWCLAAYIHCKVTCHRCQMLTGEGTLEMN